MTPELLRLHEMICRCVRPEELFGAPLKASELKSLYRQFARISHADKYQRADEKRLAHVVFTKLNDLHQQAVAKFEAGTYGRAVAAPAKTKTPPVIRSKKGLYVVTAGLGSGDLSISYSALLDDKTPVLLKMAKKHPVANAALEAEGRVVALLNEAAKGTVSYKQFIPTLTDWCMVKVGTDTAPRRVNVFQPVDGFFPLTEVVAQYPQGIDARHFVWIFNRLLTVLSFAHSQGVIHGAVLPTRILIHPTTHAIRLIDWDHAVPKGKTIAFMSKGYDGWYPYEVPNRQPASAATDLYMAAVCMAYILGGDFGVIPKAVPAPFHRLLDTCLMKNQFRRPQSAWELFTEFETVAKSVFGEKKYVKLEMRA